MAAGPLGLGAGISGLNEPESLLTRENCLQRLAPKLDDERPTQLDPCADQSIQVVSKYSA